MAAKKEKSAESADDWLIEPSEKRPREPEPQDKAEEFAPEEATPPAADEGVGPETEQWLVPGDAGRNGHTKAPEPSVVEPPPARPADADPALAARVKELELRVKEEADRADREAKRADKAGTGKRGDSKKLEQAKESLKEQREANADLAKRIRDLQTELQTFAKQAKAELAQALKERDAEAKQQISDAEEKFSSREAELRGRIDELEAALADEKKRSKAKSAPAPKRPAAAKTTRTRRAGTKNGKLELNEAKFEELRELGLSVTQSARLIAYRDVRGGYESLDELESIPGISQETLAELRDRLTVSS